MSVSRNTIRGAGSIRSMSRRIKRRGVLRSVRKMHQRRAFAIQRTQWEVLRWLEEQELAEQTETAVRLAEDSDFTIE